jgi:3-keto-disaccharide hydrolase
MKILIFLLVLGGSVQAAAQETAPYRKGNGWTALLNGHDLGGWHTRDRKPNEWFTSPATHWTAVEPEKLSAQPGRGPIIVNGPLGRTADLISDATFGDVELYLEFQIPKKSNSGIYLQGLYELQILDSFGTADPGVHDCGAIYERWLNGKGVGGSPPRKNASRPPGEWQSFHVLFRAPRFDASGKKTENGRFLRVIHNGVVVQENVPVEGPTRASLDAGEAPRGPLMIQGDHGPVALRNIHIRPLQGQ